MNTKIKRSEIGHFKSANDAKTYQEAMKVKKEIEEAAQTIIKYDDKVDIDFNNPVRGDVLIDNIKIKGQNYRGRVTYDPETGALTEVDMEKKLCDIGLGLRSKVHYGFREVDNKQVYEINDTGDWKAGRYTSGTISEKRKLVIDEKGDMEYKTRSRDDINYDPEGGLMQF